MVCRWREEVWRLEVEVWRREEEVRRWRGAWQPTSSSTSSCPPPLYSSASRWGQTLTSPSSSSPSSSPSPPPPHPPHGGDRPSPGGAGDVREEHRGEAALRQGAPQHLPGDTFNFTLTLPSPPPPSPPLLHLSPHHPSTPGGWRGSTRAQPGPPSPWGRRAAVQVQGGENYVKMM